MKEIVNSENIFKERELSIVAAHRRRYFVTWRCHVFMLLPFISIYLFNEKPYFQLKKKIMIANGQILIYINFYHTAPMRSVRDITFGSPFGYSYVFLSYVDIVIDYLKHCEKKKIDTYLN